MADEQNSINPILFVKWFLQHVIHLGDRTIAPRSWKHVLKCHGPGALHLTF